MSSSLTEPSWTGPTCSRHPDRRRYLAPSTRTRFSPPFYPFSFFQKEDYRRIFIGKTKRVIFPLPSMLSSPHTHPHVLARNSLQRDTTTANARTKTCENGTRTKHARNPVRSTTRAARPPSSAGRRYGRHETNILHPATHHSSVAQRIHLYRTETPHLYIRGMTVRGDY